MRTVSADGLDLLAGDTHDAATWKARVERDRARARALQTPRLGRATEELLARAVAANAEAVALTGSTARGRRTATSDLDLHVVGERPPLDGVDVEVDVHATTAEVLLDRLRDGDDYVQWTLRFGCILYDQGILREAATELVGTGRWPSPDRKLTQVRRMLELAHQIVASEDHEAAVEQVRSVLTGLGRWKLLAAGSFPLARAELPDQLRAIGEHDLAAALERCMLGAPSLDQLRADLAQVTSLLAAANAR